MESTATAAAKVEDGSSDNIIIKVSCGSNNFDVFTSSQSTFADLKWEITRATGLDPEAQNLLFKGKEKDDNEQLHMAGVTNNAKVIVLEDSISSPNKNENLEKVEDVKENTEDIAKANAYQPNPYQQLTPQQQLAYQQQLQQSQQSFFNNLNQQPQQPETQTHEDSPNLGSTSVENQPRKRTIKGRFHGVPVSCPKTVWVAAEEAWLAECWINTSEDTITENSQRRLSFWETVKQRFNNNSSGWKRGTDQISSKWRNINKCCTQFKNIYREHVITGKSGCNEASLYDRAVIEYRNTYAKPFTMKEAWEVLKDHPKWGALPALGGLTRRLLDEDDEDPVEPQEEQVEPAVNLADPVDHLFEPDTIRRPIGRTAARKAARTSSSSSPATSSTRSGSRVEELLGELLEYKRRYSEARSAQLQQLVDAENARVAMEVVNFMGIDLSRYPPSEHDNIRRMQQNLREKYVSWCEPRPPTGGNK